MDKNRKCFQPYFDNPLPKPHKRVSIQEAFTTPVPSQYSSSPDQEQGASLEESCKLVDSVCTEWSLSFEGIHGNSTSLTTVSSLPENCVISKADLQDQRNRSQYITNPLQHRDSIIINSEFTPTATGDSSAGVNASGHPYHKTHSDPPQWATGYPATPANSPIKRTIRSAGNQFRVSSVMCTSLNDSPLMEESLSSSSNETLIEEIEIRDTVEPKSQCEPSLPVNQTTSHLSMQQFPFPQAGRPASNRLHRYNYFGVVI